MSPLAWLRAWWGGRLRRCIICGRQYDYETAQGEVVLESWGPSGIMLGQKISHETCCPGFWYDIDYIHHPTGDEPQVNSKPGEQIVPLTHQQMVQWRASKGPKPGLPPVSDVPKRPDEGT